ncbi:5781_t:CDS:1, partial [Ambispora leptoticha]
MSILQGALEKLLAEARSTKQKELQSQCTAALEKLYQEINMKSKEAAQKRLEHAAKIKNTSNTNNSTVTDAVNSSVSEKDTGKVEERESTEEQSKKEIIEDNEEKLSEKRNSNNHSNSSNESLVIVQPAQSPELESPRSRSSISSGLFIHPNEDLPKILMGE